MPTIYTWIRWHSILRCLHIYPITHVLKEKQLKCWLGPKDYNIAHDDDADGTSEDETGGVNDTSRDDTV